MSFELSNSAVIGEALLYGISKTNPNKITPVVIDPATGNLQVDATVVIPPITISSVQIENKAGTDMIEPATNDEQLVQSTKLDSIITNTGASATEATVSTLLTEATFVAEDFATSDKQLPDNHQVTVSNLATIPLITGFATEVTLSSINGKDFATETTLSTLNGKVTAVDTTNLATEATVGTLLTEATFSGTDFSTESTLSALNGKVTAVDTTNLALDTTVSTAATTIVSGIANGSTLADVEGKLDTLIAKDFATSAKQLADNHQVTVSNIASTPLITGFATETTLQKTFIPLEQTGVNISEKSFNLIDYDFANPIASYAVTTGNIATKSATKIEFPGVPGILPNNEYIVSIGDFWFESSAVWKIVGHTEDGSFSISDLNLIKNNGPSLADYQTLVDAGYSLNIVRKISATNDLAEQLKIKYNMGRGDQYTKYVRPIGNDIGIEDFDLSNGVSITSGAVSTGWAGIDACTIPVTGLSGVVEGDLVCVVGKTSTGINPVAIWIGLVRSDNTVALGYENQILSRNAFYPNAALDGSLWWFKGDGTIPADGRSITVYRYKRIATVGYISQSYDYVYSDLTNDYATTPVSLNKANWGFRANNIVIQNLTDQPIYFSINSTIKSSIIIKPDMAREINNIQVDSIKIKYGTVAPTEGQVSFDLW